MQQGRIGVRRGVRRSRRLAWVRSTVTPWCVALALIVSATADAGQQVRLDMSQSRRLIGLGTPADLVPLGDLGTAFPILLPSHDPVVREARLIVGDAEDLQADADEISPDLSLKPRAGALPDIDRSHKGDPAVSLRPTFDTRLRRPGSLAGAARAEVAFAGENPLAPPLAQDPAGAAPPGPDSVDHFEPVPAGQSLTTVPTSALASPTQGIGATTPHMGDGSTPSVARAASLASSTPAADDATPIEIGALPKFSRGPNGVVAGGRTVVGIAPARPDYAALIDAARTTSEQKCLATAIYFEARSEPEEGQAAVAQVILNRVASGLYPSSVCGVVFQNQQRHNACQFSFACEGRALRVTEGDPWERAVRVAREVTDGTAYVSDVGASTHYHANYVRPLWASRLTKTDKIGHHIFYKLKPGQT